MEKKLIEKLENFKKTLEEQKEYANIFEEKRNKFVECFLDEIDDTESAIAIKLTKKGNIRTHTFGNDLFYPALLWHAAIAMKRFLIDPKSNDETHLCGKKEEKDQMGEQ